MILPRLLTSIIFSLILSSCSYKDKSNSTGTWTGDYNYEEEPIKAIASYSMVMDWTLSIKEKGGGCQGVLEVKGQQTYIKALTNITGDTNAIAITYISRIDGSNENLLKGDTLFMLIRDAGKLKTRWFALEPRLSENMNKECNCFIKSKNGSQ